METDRERWDTRWAAATTAVAAAAPTALAEHPELIEQLPTTGRGLDLACGLGAQSLWLAHLGLRVDALDVSPVAIAQLSAAAERLQATVTARVWDTDDGLPLDLDDLAVILCQRYRVPDLYGELTARLRIGGLLIITVLSAVGLSGDVGPFHAPAGELVDAFDRDDVDVLHHSEGGGLASIVVRRIG